MYYTLHEPNLHGSWPVSCHYNECVPSFWSYTSSHRSTGYKRRLWDTSTGTRGQQGGGGEGQRTMHDTEYKLNKEKQQTTPSHWRTEQTTTNDEWIGCSSNSSRRQGGEKRTINRRRLLLHLAEQWPLLTTDQHADSCNAYSRGKWEGKASIGTNSIATAAAKWRTSTAYSRAVNRTSEIQLRPTDWLCYRLLATIVSGPSTASSPSSLLPFPLSVEHSQRQLLTSYSNLPSNPVYLLSRRCQQHCSTPH